MAVSAYGGLQRWAGHQDRRGLLPGGGDGLYLLPNVTWAHHWVIGTPFQYLAIAMAITVVGSSTHASVGTGFREPGSAYIGVRRTDDRSGPGQLPDWLARSWGLLGDLGSVADAMGELCAKRAGQDMFLAANWGVATQIYCLADGHPGLVRELFAWPAPATWKNCSRSATFAPTISF